MLIVIVEVVVVMVVVMVVKFGTDVRHSCNDAIIPVKVAFTFHSYFHCCYKIHVNTIII